ncbi:MAG: CBS domain-containing protein [Candidatus Aenigmarchaeota archaeon]|nr:CBS domain-containing protein [Candidatus Aenigmarchaeota archaeon]
MRIKDCNIGDEHQQVSPEENLTSVKKRYCHFLVVVEDKKPIGIVTNNDIIKHVKTEEDYEKLKFRDIMTTPVVSVKIDDELDDAVKIMKEGGFMSLPVVDENDDFVGLITYFDYLGKIADDIKKKGKVEM